MDPVSTYIGPILKELLVWCLDLISIHDPPEVIEHVKILKVELELLQTCLTYIESWRDAANHLHLCSLKPDLKVALVKARKDLSLASRKGYEQRANFLYPAVSGLHEKLELFRPRIKQAYHCLWNYSFRSNFDSTSYLDHLIKFSGLSLFRSHSDPINDFNHLMMFTRSTVGHLSDVCIRKDEISLPVFKKLKALRKNIGSLMLFVGRSRTKDWIWVIQHPEGKGLLTHLRAQVVRAAHLSYLFLVDEMDESTAQEMITKISDVQKKLMPGTPQLTMIHNKVLEDTILSLGTRVENRNLTVLQKFVKFLVPDEHIFCDLREGLRRLSANLVSFRFYEDGTHGLRDIRACFKEVESISYLFHVDEMTEDMAKEADLALVMLLGKLELLKAKFVLILLKSRLVKPGILDHFPRGSIQRKKESGELIWRHIEALTSKVSYHFRSSNAHKFTGRRVENGTDELLEKVELFYAELFLMKLLSSKDSLIVAVKDQIKSLYQGLIFLRTFLMNRLEENGKLILEYVRSVAREVGAFYYSFHVDDTLEEVSSKITLLLPDLLETIMLVKAEVKEICLQIRSRVRSNFPKTHGLALVDFLLGNLRKLLNCRADAITFLNHHIEFVLHGMEYILGQFNRHSELQNLESRILEAASDAEYIIDLLVVGEGVFWYHWMWLFNLIEEIKQIKHQVTEISEKKTCDIGVHNSALTPENTISPASTPSMDEVVLDLPDQTQLILDQLTRGSSRRTVVSIFGMPGLGKTTLAKKVYNSTSYHFNISAWGYLSQVYQKRKLLIDILSDIVAEHIDNFCEMSNAELEFKLYQCLKGKRYLLVLDDMWSIEAWNGLKSSLPDDDNGSRILITSRLQSMALGAESNSHLLRQLTDAESWQLLQKKLLLTKDFGEELLEVGEQIAKNCKGLPLAIVAIAGILGRTDKQIEWWKQVAESLSSLIADDPQTKCMDILESSYKHLPDYLKPCFLYLGTSLKDKEISAQKLKCLWIAEGFIQNTDQETLEDVAEKYLIELVGRSLVMVSRRRSKDRGVKACSIHDMLRDLCLKRCKEENFSQLITGYDELFPNSSEELDYGIDPDYSHPSNSITYEKHRLSICAKRKHFVMLKPSGPHVRSLLFFATSDTRPQCPYDVLFISRCFKLLRVLDVERINMGNTFFKGVELLLHLRYLAVSGDIDSIPVSIANLWSLETLLVKGLIGKVTLPSTIWSLKSLRHVHITSHAAFSLQEDEEDSSALDNLFSLSKPYLSNGKDTEKILRRLPKLQKLSCIFSESEGDVANINQFPVLDFLTELESLKILYSGRNSCPTKFSFPLNLRKLTLSNFRLPWDCISEIGKLTNLEVLKLVSRAFEGETWDMGELEFKELKFLKLENLNIVKWDASSENLPRLQRLVLRRCKHLGEIPSSFAEIDTLEIIEVQFCSSLTEESAKSLQEDVENLNVLINL